TDKLSLRWRAPERGEVIVFWRVPGRAFVSRVIAVGGDTVAVTGGVVQVNGRALPRRAVGPTTYRDRVDGRESIEQAHAWIEELGGHGYRVLARTEVPDAEQFDYGSAPPGYEPCALRGRPDDGAALEPVAGGCRVPPGTLFVMGDNRENSADSRFWGAVRIDAVIGRVTGIWASRFGREAPWSRIGAID
ncbi:MAG TPA: signal peptidase I, partial [Kofleriaceae bacterium]|nr:signal peptidase I [Kofleriaceae bacterium]